MIRTYTELISFPTFEERFRYLQLCGAVGHDTFGFDRVFNQKFYRSTEWKEAKQKVIIRDRACDLAMPDHDIYGSILVHHMNPITLDDIKNASDFLLNPEYLVCVSLLTHNAIHYSDESLLPKLPVNRSKYDTCPWKEVSA